MTATLIEKLEAAAEGSRALDAQIHAFVFGITHSDDWPHYTTLLDAALTLVPEGDYDQFWIRSSRGDERHKLWRVRIALETIEENDTGTGPVAFGQADTPALALCIAAFRARFT